MTAKFAETFIAMNAKSLPKENSQIAHLKSHLSAISPEQEILVQATNLKSPSTGLLLAFLLGGLGIDRFYNGQTLLGVLKLLTLGGLGIWSFIDLFLIMKAVRKRNYEHLMAIPILNSTSSLPNETQLISNEEWFIKKYKGKPLIISGVVGSIDSDMNDDPAVNFEVSSLFGTVVASFRKTEFDKVR